MCIFCFLTKTNRYLASFISHFFFSRSDFVSHVSSTDNTRNIVPQLCLCVLGVCVCWKHKEKWNHSSGGSGGSNWKIVNQALALACSYLLHARASVIVASVVVLCCCYCENSNQTIPLKLIKTFNTSPCLFWFLFCFIELLNLLPLLFRSVVVVWCFTLESKFCVYRETSALDANFLFS